ncbi:MAG: leucyl/phenylalanyl-tRNA--protein transferase, partial [Solirubrobacteraceae bacterium]|nr:leucyl/phenylalanyl-tRNA--protein transferase [Solirubrobacteraceae bacterium]
MRSEVDQAIFRYAAGAFPMDDEDAVELPWYTAPERAIFELGAEPRAHVRRKVRRDERACAAFELDVDRDYEQVLHLCATPPPDEGVWITPRLADLYLALNEAGVAHSFELWTPEGELAAGILGVTLGRAAMLESMRKRRPAAGNALLIRTLDHLAEHGFD